jgi:UDP-N-acetylglucosamine 4-epimerase
MKNIQPFLENSNFEFIQGDICDFSTCNDAMQGVDYIIHQAALGSVPRSIAMPVAYCENNILGFVNILEAARINKIKRVVYASSSSVYGDDESLIKREGIEGKCRSPYALTKKMDEEWAKIYAALYDMEIIGLRYFNVFGPKQNPEGQYAAVIPKFIKTLSKGESPVIYGDGTQSRDFTYVMNVVDANIKACFVSDQAVNRVYNIGTGTTETVNEIFFLISKELNTEVKATYDNERRGDVKFSLADISLAKEFLDYDPKWSFAEGLSKTISWYLKEC